MPGYITGTNHGETVVAALNQFHRALTRRWREVVCDAIVNDSWDFPRVIRREIAPHHYHPLWNFSSVPARRHINSGTCAYVAWVRAGQNGDPGSVRCDGSTGTDVDHDVEMFDIPEHGEPAETVTIPPTIECGVGTILARVEDWAYGERLHVLNQVPMFDHHDMGVLEAAHDAFLRIGGALNLVAGAGSDAGATRTVKVFEQEAREQFEDMFKGHGDLDGITSNIASVGDPYWWTDWTGLAADYAKFGFFGSVQPTLNNQSVLAGHLANLYSDRAAIIEMGRNNTLNLIQRATDALDETELVTTDRATAWKTVQGIGLAISVTGAWSGVGTVAGAIVMLAGFLGENLDDGSPSEEYGHDLVGVGEQLNDQMRALNYHLDEHETELFQAALYLRSALSGFHSYDLELYDLTRNDPTGNNPDGGDNPVAAREVDINISTVLSLAERCYLAGALYEALLPIVASTADADLHLADKDGHHTRGDEILLETRAHLESFLKTTCGRYFVAGEQVTKAAQLFAETEEGNRQTFETVMGRWDEYDVGPYQKGFDPTAYPEYAEPTTSPGRQRVNDPDDRKSYIVEEAG